MQGASGPVAGRARGEAPEGSAHREVHLETPTPPEGRVTSVLGIEVEVEPPTVTVKKASGWAGQLSKEKAMERFAAQEYTSRCRCGWSMTGDADVVSAAYRDHREQEHVET